MSNSAEIQLDPVCGTQLSNLATAHTAYYLGNTYHFCSIDCLRKFEQRPEAYVVRTGSAQRAELNE